MDAKELIDEIERPSTDRTVEEASTGKCDHILGTRDPYDLVTESGFKDHMEVCGEHLEDGYTKQDAFEKVFKYCPECGEKLKES